MSSPADVPGKPAGQSMMTWVVVNPVHRFRWCLVNPNRSPWIARRLPTDSDSIPVGTALSGTSDILVGAFSQVKGYLRIHRVVHETFPLPTARRRSSTVHAQPYPQRAALRGLVGAAPAALHVDSAAVEPVEWRLVITPTTTSTPAAAIIIIT